MRTTRIGTLISTCILFVLAACADATHVVRRDPRNGILRPEGSAFIGLSRDGMYGARVYAHSGDMTSRLIEAAFTPHLRRCEVATTPSTTEEALDRARSGGFEYLIVPKILSWEDRATEWNGKPDRVEVLVQIFDTSSGALMESATVQGRSGLATFGGDHPQDLLPGPLSELARSLVAY